MSLPAIIFTVYFVTGCLVAVAVMVSDFAKKKTSIAGLLGDLAMYHGVAFVIFTLLWPLWLALMFLFCGDDEEDTSAKTHNVKSNPNSGHDPNA